MITILDGAMGSELIARGASLPTHTWSAHTNIHNPNLIYQIHSEYIQAGANIITANTFRTTRRAFQKTGLSLINAQRMAHSSLKNAIQMAHKASNGRVKILGSIAPLEDCYKPELFPGINVAKNEFHVISNLLMESGVDAIILETMNNIPETLTALNVLKACNIPIYVSYYLTSSTKLASDESLQAAISILKPFNIKALLLNCSSINIINSAIDELIKFYNGVWGIYPNFGTGIPSQNGDINKIISDDAFLSLMEKGLENGASILGGCCGSSPRHIKLLQNKFIN